MIWRIVTVWAACTWVPLVASEGYSADDIVFADFEGESYAPWQATGKAFGPGPARGTLPNQMHVDGFRGRGLVNSFVQGDGSTGALTSPEFKIERKHIHFLIGGGGHVDKTCVNLIVAGKTLRTAVGPNTNPGGGERLEPQSWDVANLAGQTAKIVVVDDATGGWGHINLDHIVFSDAKGPTVVTNARRELTAANRYLHFPVKNGGVKRVVAVHVDGREERRFDIELADGPADWWAPLDISAWKGRPLSVTVDKLRDDSLALSSIAQSDGLLGAENLYREPLRPQFHFSARRGWVNDPNGLVFHDGEYHLFFQHNPYGWNWGNMHWGHAVSRDLVQWEELPEALYPDRFGPMFSGSAVVDWKNTSGFGQAGKPPLVLFYTAAGNPTVQCLAYSVDRGRTFTKYAGNPIIAQITPGNRDPKVIWHEPTGSWVMVLYVEKNKVHTIQFFSSPDLKNWTATGQIDGFFECPDLFPLSLDGDPRQTKWVLTAASSEYLVGTFDGSKFTPETGKLPGHRGRGFYAAQTFSDIPQADGRRIQIGWGQMPSPGMSFNQMMCAPCELTLRKTAEGPRLAWKPIKELERLRDKSQRHGPLELRPDEPPQTFEAGELLELRVRFTPAAKGQTLLTVRGVEIVYDAEKQEIVAAGHKAPCPRGDGQQEWTILVDRTSLEIFAQEGLTYLPLPVIAKPAEKNVSLSANGAPRSWKAWKFTRCGQPFPLRWD